MTISQRIFSVIEEKNLKYSDLADILDISKSVISSWKSRNSDPPARYLVQICDFLGISLVYLLTGHQTSTKSLSEDEKKVLSVYSNLDESGKTIVMAKAIEELRRQEN